MKVVVRKTAEDSKTFKYTFRVLNKRGVVVFEYTVSSSPGSAAKEKSFVEKYKDIVLADYEKVKDYKKTNYPMNEWVAV